MRFKKGIVGPGRHLNFRVKGGCRCRRKDYISRGHGVFERTASAGGVRSVFAKGICLLGDYSGDAGDMLPTTCSITARPASERMK